MNEDEFRASLIKRDSETLEQRIDRWNKLLPAYYRGYLPRLLWNYVTEADDMYIDGHFIGVIFLCASIVELILSDQLKSNTKLSIEEIERFGLDQTLILCNRLDVLTDNERLQINELKSLRNTLIHADAGKLHKIAKKRYDFQPVESDGIAVDLYIGSFGETGIDQDAINCLRFVSALSVKFYGDKNQVGPI